MTTYTITVGAGSGSLSGYYGYLNLYGPPYDFGSISPSTVPFAAFVWDAAGSVVQIQTGIVDDGTPTDPLDITWNGQVYSCAAVGDGSYSYADTALGGPYPTSGTTTFSIGAAGAISGTLFGVDGADAAAATGAVIVSGALNGTDGADTAAASSGNSGALAATDGADMAAAAGSVLVAGALAGADGADVAAASGAARVSGGLAATDGADTASISAAVRISGSITGADGADGAAGIGSAPLPSGLPAIAVTMRPGGGPVAPVSYEVGHRLAGAADWTVATLAAVSGTLFLPGYTAGQLVELRARAASVSGAWSDWSGVTTHVVGSSDPTIRDVATFAAHWTGTAWHYAWALEVGPVSVEPAGIKIRHGLGASLGWDDLDDLHTGLLTVSPWDLSAPPATPGPHTFGACAVTAAGAYGTPVLVTVSV